MCGVHVLGSPQPLRILSTKACARQCQLQPSALEVSAGEDARLALALCDEYGNELSAAPATLNLELHLDRSDVAKIEGSASTVERAIDRLDRVGGDDVAKWVELPSASEVTPVAELNN